jgi:hypothetical protein
MTYLRVNAHTDGRRIRWRRRRFIIGRVLVLDDPPAAPTVSSISVRSAFAASSSCDQGHRYTVIKQSRSEGAGQGGGYGECVQVQRCTIVGTSKQSGDG